jgi:magnesium transporter
MIVDCAVYDEGTRLNGRFELHKAYEAARDHGKFVWIGLHKPTAEEFESVRREFDLHELAVEDAIHAHQRPKLETYDDMLFMVLKPVHYVDPDEVIELGEILLFVGADYIVSVRHGDVMELGDVRRRLEGEPELLRCGPSAVLYAILDRIVDGYMPAVEGVENDIEEVEREVFSAERLNPAERIYKLRREATEFYRAAAPLVDPAGRLASGELGLVTEGLHEYLRDVHDHLLRVVGRIEVARENLGSILTANLTQVGVRQNEDMRRISAWVAIIAVPTMIAGIYGMNFDHMPELGWSLGYPAVLLTMAVLCTGLYRYFKRAGWL